jgi:ribosomal protein S1
MKRALFFFFIFLIFAMSICLTSCCSYFGGNEKETTTKSTETTGETASEDDFKVFTRYAEDGRAVLHSFMIPTSWQVAKEESDSSYSGQESFFNGEKTKIVFISFTTIDDLEKLGISKLKGEDSFAIAIDKVKEYYINSGLLGKLDQKGKSGFIGENKRIKAYLSRFEGPTDLSNMGTELGKLSEKGNKTIYISFLSYDDRLIGYYFMIDALSDIKDDENIIVNFVNSLKISKF